MHVMHVCAIFITFEWSIVATPNFPAYDESLLKFLNINIIHVYSEKLSIRNHRYEYSPMKYVIKLLGRQERRNFQKVQTFVR